MEQDKENVAGLARNLYALFLRVVSMFLLLFALQYWGRLVGIFDGADYRFDTMAAHWRAGGSLLAVLLPVAALGLWGLFSWGPVVWLITVGVEISMYTWFSDLFGRADLRVSFHLLAIVIFLAFRFAILVLTNKK
ncbi:MAG: DUF6163 family protein [Rhizobiaceae bacterium]